MHWTWKSAQRKPKQFDKEILRIHQFGLPMDKRLNAITHNLDDYGLTYLEYKSIGISHLLEMICKAKITRMPENLKPIENLDECN